MESRGIRIILFWCWGVKNGLGGEQLALTTKKTSRNLVLGRKPIFHLALYMVANGRFGSGNGGLEGGIG